jgi:hypothetical protein
MKLKLFGNAAQEPINLMLLNGGYDAEAGRVVLLVKNETQSGTLAFEVTEARRISEILATNIPNVERVEPASEVREILRPG